MKQKQPNQAGPLKASAISPAVLPKNPVPAKTSSMAGTCVIHASVKGQNISEGMKAAFSEISKELAKHGLGFHNIGFVQAQLRSMDDLAAFNASFAGALGGNKPAGYCVIKEEGMPPGASAKIFMLASEGKKEPITPESFPAPDGPFSYGILSGRKIYVSGQFSPEKSGFDMQAALAVENVKAVLKAGGASLQDVAEATFFCTDVVKFLERYDHFESIFPNWHVQINNVVQVSGLPLGADFGMSCVAEKPKGK